MESGLDLATWSQGIRNTSSNQFNLLDIAQGD